MRGNDLPFGCTGEATATDLVGLAIGVKAVGLNKVLLYLELPGSFAHANPHNGGITLEGLMHACLSDGIVDAGKAVSTGGEGAGAGAGRLRLGARLSSPSGPHFLATFSFINLSTPGWRRATSLLAYSSGISAAGRWTLPTRWMHLRGSAASLSHQPNNQRRHAFS